MVRINNKNKEAMLGMPYGTAYARLRKSVMFDLVQKCNLDSCYVCGLTIDSVEELSIEHKLPWEGVDAELFWSLENIAFSHLRCNRPHRHNPSNRKSFTDGYVWCYSCQSEKPLSEFYPDRSAKSHHTGNVSSKCKICSNARRAEYRDRVRLEDKLQRASIV